MSELWFSASLSRRAEGGGPVPPASVAQPEAAGEREHDCECCGDEARALQDVCIPCGGLLLVVDAWGGGLARHEPLKRRHRLSVERTPREFVRRAASAARRCTQSCRQKSQHQLQLKETQVAHLTRMLRAKAQSQRA